MNISRRKFIQYTSFAVGSGVAAGCSNTTASNASSSGTSPVANTGKLDRVTMGTNWLAQAEQGGFYQAVAKGIYQAHELDVTLRMGGPQVSGTQLLMGGAIDFFIGYGADTIKSIESGIPKITVAALFQKDPQVLIAHPDVGVEDLKDLKGRPILLTPQANSTFWPFLKSKYGFTDDQKRPYNFNPGPFLADKNVAQQGYVSSEPYIIRKVGKIDPVVFLLANYGYAPYAITIESRKDFVDKNPAIVQRFVDASIKGWYSYLKDPAPGDALIKKDNPEMTDSQLAYARSTFDKYKLVNGGDAESKGIGAMTDERWKAFFDSMVVAEVFKPETDYKQAYTLEFVNKGTQAYQA